MILSFIGPSGCGKGTQANLFSQRKNFKVFSTGDILRDEFFRKTDLGISLFEKYWKSGKWVPDDIVSELLFDRINKDSFPENVIFDAYPRTKNQAIILDQFLSYNGVNLNFVINFVLEDDTSRDRIIGREKEEKRLDVSDEAISNRLENYRNNFNDICDFYKGKIFNINGEDSVEGVYNSILSIVYGAKE